MTSCTPRFLCWTIDPVVNAQRAQCLLDMLCFIRDGLRDLGGPPHIRPDFVEAENFVKAAIFEKTSSPMAKPVPKRMMNDAGDTLDIITAVFKDQHNWASNNAPVGGFRCGAVTDTLAERLDAIWHPEINEMESGSLQVAFDVARSNFARAATRITLMHVIPELIGTKLEPAVWSRIREDLWLRKLGLQRDLLLFGALLGGAHLQEAVKLVAVQTCVPTKEGIEFSVVHFLTRDGVSPGRWASDFEDGLRQDINGAFERLMALPVSNV